jgi:predicted O-methyltransferase YrrM
MKNCIFITVFNNKKYIDLLFLLLDSIFIYGNLDDNVDILIYTSTEFMNIIKQSNLYDKNKIKFETNETKNNTSLACKARLDLFSLASINNYKKILYLDTDIIVTGDINILFNLCKRDVLYAVQEGTINYYDSDYDIYWGQILFKDKEGIDVYKNKIAFNSGVLLFNNCLTIKNLFIQINLDINSRSQLDLFGDQPFIIYNAFKYNCYDNEVLNNYVSIYIQNPDKYDISKVIHHFAGSPGTGDRKYKDMYNFFYMLRDYTINNNINIAFNYINQYLLPIINFNLTENNELLEGNIFTFHNTTTLSPYFENKRKNISNLVLNKNIKNVMEIGFNSGFSTLLMLITNPNINITCFDLGEHSYTVPCYQQLKKTFGNRIKLILGDSTVVLKDHNDIYDLIHIDGGHSIEVASSDIINSYRLSKPKTTLIFDDYDFSDLQPLWNSFVEKLNLKKLDTFVYDNL